MRRQTRSWFTLTKRFGQSRGGHAAIMFSILAFPLVLAVGFALDFAQASKYRTELQNVADAVALAAVRGLPTSEAQGRLDGMSLYDALMNDLRAGLVSDNITITFENTPDYKAIVEITADARMSFGNSINLGTVRFEVDASAVLGRQGTEVALVLDLSGSMTTTRMRALGSALSVFDSAINASAAARDRLRIAAIPFAQNVTLPLYAADWLSLASEKAAATAAGRTCFASQGRTLDTSITSPSSRSFQIAPNYAAQCMPEQTFALTQDFAQLRAMAAAYSNPPAWRRDWQNSRGTSYWGTNLYTGAAWAARLLDPSWGNYLPAGSAAESPNRANKFALIMTDGAQDEILGVSRTQADQNLIAICNQMRTQGISVFTIGFAVTSATETLLKRCADNDNQFVRADNEAGLISAFERISRTIGDSRARLVF